jgi:hypothetical protein
MEDVVAREVIYEWNGCHSWREGKALLPLNRDCSSSSDHPVPQSDLLVAFFCARTGAPNQPAIEPEIERQIREKRPVLIYVSGGRADLAHAAAAIEVPTQDELRKRFGPDAPVESFRDEKEFRARFAQQLEQVLTRHPHFRIEGEFSPESAVPPMVEKHPTAPPEYSKLAQSLLIQACDDPEAYIGRVKDSRGLKIQVNGRQVVDQSHPELMAEWEAAFQEILAAGLIRDAGFNGQLFQISPAGFQFLETLGKFPIGYIAELGSV